MQCTTICKQRIHACLLVEEGVAGRASRDRDLARMLLAGGVLAVGGSVAKPHVTVGTVQVLGGFGHHASSAIAGAALKQREVSPVLLAGKVRAKVGRLATPPRATHLTIKWPGQRVSAVGLAQAAAPPHQECRGRCTSHGRCDVPSEIVDGGPHGCVSGCQHGGSGGEADQICSILRARLAKSSDLFLFFYSS